MFVCRCQKGELLLRSIRSLPDHGNTRFITGENQVMQAFDPCESIPLEKLAEEVRPVLLPYSSLPTNCAWLTTDDSSTTRTMSSRHPTLVLRKRCLTKQKHQSGETSMKEISAFLFITLHARYCIMNLFLFQLG